MGYREQQQDDFDRWVRDDEKARRDTEAEVARLRRLAFGGSPKETTTWTTPAPTPPNKYSGDWPIRRTSGGKFAVLIILGFFPVVGGVVGFVTAAALGVTSIVGAIFGVIVGAMVLPAFLEREAFGLVLGLVFMIVLMFSGLYVLFQAFLV